ncbi:helix-turn-helix domain-containing protein [Methylococcus geothermalis]|uniref:helix-turn-helix domain-containing protein n=1 Tax=Methylococcus geothermalis TaxID=2681310 RepID=UPI001E2D8754|nr:helix-turn-helix domain-containing protein [Methylococcus geothermalis]
MGDKQTLRARIVLMTAAGRSTREIMETLKVSNPTLSLWRRRYRACGIEGWKKGNTRPSRVPPLPDMGKSNPRIAGTFIQVADENPKKVPAESDDGKKYTVETIKEHIKAAWR